MGARASAALPAVIKRCTIGQRQRTGRRLCRAKAPRSGIASPWGRGAGPGVPGGDFTLERQVGQNGKLICPGCPDRGSPPGPRPPAAGPMGAGDPEADTGLFGEHAGAGMHGELCQEIQPRPGGLLRLPSGRERDYQPHNGAVTGRPSGTGVCPPRGQRLRLRGKRLFGVAGPAGVPAVRAAGRGG